MSNTLMVGRPTKLTKTTVQKLSDSLKLGITTQEACYDAGISRTSFYTYMKESEGFSDKMNTSKNYIKRKSKALVLNSLEDGDLKTAKWYLEKYDDGVEEKLPETEDIMDTETGKLLTEAYNNMTRAMEDEKAYRER